MEKEMISKTIYIIGTVLFAVFAFRLMAESGPAINADEVKKYLAEGTGVLIDVRELEEFQDGHLKNALLVPLSKMQNDRTSWEAQMREVAKGDKTILVYCRSGRRSGIVSSELIKLGIKALNAGGFETLKNNGLPTE